MIKLLEDKINAENDTQLGKVRVILLVEDSPIFIRDTYHFCTKLLPNKLKE